MATTQAPTESAPPIDRRLDEWYVTISKIYLGRNFYREAPSLLAHLFEICGAMGPLARADWNPPAAQPAHFAVAKAVAWWFAVCAKVGLSSPEDMIWTKFPAVCSHCRLRPHNKDACEFERRRILDAKGTVAPDWEQLEPLAIDNASARPTTISDFVQMFLEIYEEPQESFAEIFARLNEELGELAEAVRVIGLAPQYFLSEAPDVFAWLVRCHCVLTRNEGVDRERWGDELAANLAKLYPDRCKDCEQDPCNCAPVLPKHLGRLAVAGPVDQARQFGPGRSFLPLSDQLRAIEQGTGKIRIAGREDPLEVSASDVSEFTDVVAQLLARVDEIGAHQREQLAEILVQLDAASKQGTATLYVLDELGFGITELRRWVRQQPGPVQSQLREFLNGAGSNIAVSLGLALAGGG